VVKREGKRAKRPSKKGSRLRARGDAGRGKYAFWSKPPASRRDERSIQGKKKLNFVKQTKGLSKGMGVRPHYGAGSGEKSFLKTRDIRVAIKKAEKNGRLRKGGI